MSRKRRVVVIGASNKPERYAYQAINILLEKKFEVIPVHPAYKKVCGINVIDNLEKLNQNDEIDTITLYVNPHHLDQNLIHQIIKINPKRVIFNPGTESSKLKKELIKSKINFIEACSLVLLKTNQF
jgi:predicted CoA-binding protein